jgi:hypothetical protein
MFGRRRKEASLDARVQHHLESLDIKYEVDEDGDYRVGFRLKNERTQIGYVRCRTVDFAGMEIMEIFSIALHSFGPFDARTTNILLQESEKVKVGGWGVVQDADDNHLAVFTAKVPTTLTSDEFFAVLFAVVQTADRMEERLSGRDDF